MKQFYFVFVFAISIFSYSQNNKSSLTCNPIITTTNPTAFGLCDGTVTIDFTNCSNPPYIIQWLNTFPSPACQTLPPSESNFTGTIYTVNTLCGCPIQYSILMENSTGEQVGTSVAIIDPAPTGIIELNEETVISIAPNPAQNVLNIDLKELNLTDVKLDISNTLGQVVLSSDIIIENQNINIEQLPNGVYLARLYSDDKHISFKKIVVQR